MIKLIIQYNAAETSRVTSGHIFSQRNNYYVQQTINFHFRIINYPFFIILVVRNENYVKNIWDRFSMQLLKKLFQSRKKIHFSVSVAEVTLYFCALWR